MIVCVFPFHSNPDQQEGIKTSTLSEHKVVMEIIWLLTDRCDTVVFMRVISDDGLKSNFCVRPHVTVPSLIQDVFSSYATLFCTLADMVDELHSFCLEVNQRKDTQKICGTYEAYAYALEHELTPMHEALSRLEERALRQSEYLVRLFLRCYVCCLIACSLRKF